MVAPTTVRLLIPSSTRFVDLVHVATEKVAEIAGLGEEDSLNMALAVREATINAIVHGNRSNPRVQVEVTLGADGRKVQVKVRDHGTGFDPAATADPTLEENRLRDTGRGLLLVRAFVDDVKFRYRPGRGMEVTLAKRIRAARDAMGDGLEGKAESRRA